MKKMDENSQIFWTARGYSLAGLVFILFPLLLLMASIKKGNAIQTTVGIILLIFGLAIFLLPWEKHYEKWRKGV